MGEDTKEVSSTMTPVEALAESWASIDGRMEAFQHERDNDIVPDDPTYTGHYDGYMIEAEELMHRLRKRGFVIMPIVDLERGERAIAYLEPAAYDAMVADMADEKSKALSKQKPEV